MVKQTSWWVTFEVSKVFYRQDATDAELPPGRSVLFRFELKSSGSDSKDEGSFEELIVIRSYLAVAFTSLFCLPNA